MTMTEANSKMQRIIARQKNHIGMLTRALEEERHTKREHLYRLRTILVAALQDAPDWRARANRELGTVKEK